MATNNIADLVQSLTTEEQEAVREFIGFLRSKAQPAASPFIAAVDEFITAHPELLSRLAR